MKRAVGLILLLVLLLTGCVAVPVEPPMPQEPYTQYVGNTQFLIDPGAQTITAEGYEFTYAYHEDGISITYPNGAVCTQRNVGDYATTTSWYNADADFISNNGADYIDCYMLLMVVPEKGQTQTQFGLQPDWMLILFGVVIIALGFWQCASPELHWHWEYGWMFKNAEPSDLALGITSAMGAIAIIAGIVMIFIGIFA